VAEAQSDPQRALAKRLFGEAMALQKAGREAEAIALYNHSLKLHPDDTAALHNLGILYRRSKAYAAAVACYRRVLALDPANANTTASLGNALKDWGKLDEALVWHRKALAMKPDDAGVLHNLGVTLRERDENEEALACFDRALALEPTRGEVAWDRALALLHMGDYERGWPAYEARWLLDEHQPPRAPLPAWDGRPAPGQGLILTTEQGFGDSIQFARFIEAARARVGRITLAVRPPLHALMMSVRGVDQVMDRSGPVGDAKLHLPLLTLPMVLGHRLEDIPGRVPYVTAPPAPSPAVAAAIDRVPGFRVGIVWSGSTTFKGNDKRATSLTRFLRFLEVPNVRLFSLQKGPPTKELDALKGEGLVVDLGSLIDDFAESAAAIAKLDLVIMTDSSVAHLCGALGRPCWVLLSAAPDWRWFSGRSDSPWYPSLRLFRQKSLGEWDEVFDAAVEALRAEVAAKK
jgi:Tfp pilus assembly protein PilF